MKKIILIIGLVLSSYSNAQYSNKNGWEEYELKGKVHFCTQKIIQIENNEEKVTKELFEFDRQGWIKQIISKFQYFEKLGWFTRGSKYNVESTTKYQYDSKNRVRQVDSLVVKSKCLSDSIQTINYKKIFSYKGKLTTIEIFENNKLYETHHKKCIDSVGVDNGFSFVKRIHNDTIKKTHSRGFESNINMSISYTPKVEYDKKGRKVSEFYHNGEKTIFEYDEKGKLIKQIELKDGSINKIINIKYDEKGNIIQKRHYDKDKKLLYKQQYQFDRQGNKTKYILFDVNENKNIEKGDRIFEYYN